MDSSASTSADYSHKSWTGKTGGAPWMQRTLIGLFRIVPLRLMYAGMSLVIPFYMLFDNRGYRASYAFFRTRVRMGAMRAFAHVYMNEYNLGKVVLDRFAMYAGRKFRVVNEGEQLFHSLCSGDSGFVLVSSHVGNTELSGYSLDVRNKTLNVLVYARETATVMANRQKMFGHTAIEMVPVSEDLSHAYTLNNVLASGDAVMIPGDRVFGSGKTVSVDFMGAPARFPVGAFTIASQRNVPAVSIFVIKTDAGTYHVHMRKLDCGDTSAMSRQEHVQALAEAYVRELEKIVRRYPDQWYNFYDFWA